jgi:hypothetical protein
VNMRSRLSLFWFGAVPGCDSAETHEILVGGTACRN